MTHLAAVPGLEAECETEAGVLSLCILSSRRSETRTPFTGDTCRSEPGLLTGPSTITRTDVLSMVIETSCRQRSGASSTPLNVPNISTTHGCHGTVRRARPLGQTSCRRCCPGMLEAEAAPWLAHSWRPEAQPPARRTTPPAAAAAAAAHSPRTPCQECRRHLPCWGRSRPVSMHSPCIHHGLVTHRMPVATSQAELRWRDQYQHKSLKCFPHVTMQS